MVLFLICRRKKNQNNKISQTIIIFILVDELTEEPGVYLCEIELKNARDTVPLKGLCHETNIFFEGLI